jgi:NAD(P)-dependent dehydrogenase (short-subunit alcohol dehydrogenase family)
MRRLAGRRAVITGGGSGIGLATARAFVREGAHVVVADIEAERAAEGLADVGEGHAPTVVAADVTGEKDVARLFADADRALGGLDILVNNVGAPGFGRIDELETADFDRVFDANVRSTFLVTRLAVPRLRASGGGAVVIMSSNAGLVAREGDPLYCAAKAALVMLARSLALGLARDGIRVNAVCPGPVDTPMYRAAVPDEEAERRALSTVPLARALRRPATAGEVAEAVVFLASDEARYITGAALPVDGGKTAGIAEPA